MFFIIQGLVEAYVNENDEKPFLYFPKNSYFGDYQIFFNLKCNFVLKTLSDLPEERKTSKEEKCPDIFFMCIAAENLKELCELFP